MIKIDFHGSTHGHFLEYVANVYIMQTAPSKQCIFKPPTYSAHAPDQTYLSNRLIICGHFSNPNHPGSISADDTIIRIVIDPNDDKMFFVALTNLLYKAGDLGFENQILRIPESIRNNPSEHRNNWYSKLNERHQYAAHYSDFSEVSNSVFNFKFNAFFSFNEFCIELSNLAKFLNQLFFPDQTLFELWTEFIKVNQGWQSYTKCDTLLNNILSNADSDIDCSILEQGWLNFNLSKICRLYDGKLFDQHEYPSNTKIVYELVQNHIAFLNSL